MVEDSGATDKKEPLMKFYHRFDKRTCYEFTMGLRRSPLMEFNL